MSPPHRYDDIAPQLRGKHAVLNFPPGCNAGLASAGAHGQTASPVVGYGGGGRAVPVDNAERPAGIDQGTWVPAGISQGKSVQVEDVALPAGMSQGKSVQVNNVALPAGMGQGSRIPVPKILDAKKSARKVGLNSF